MDSYFSMLFIYLFYRYLGYIYNYYPIETEEGVVLSQSFEDIEPDYEEVQNILLSEFNYQYAYEKEPE